MIGKRVLISAGTRILLICFITNYTFDYSAQNRALYVDNFANILGTYHLEKELFEFAKKHEIKELILYDLNKINKRFPLGDRSQNQILADFIVKAKKEYDWSVLEKRWIAENWA